MITREQALTLTHGDEVHFQTCTRYVGPRSGVKFRQTICRVTTHTAKTWKTRPSDFYIGVVHGLRNYGSITHNNNSSWHLPSECPLNDLAPVK